jgi:DNA-binding CsgD family transcriptional regulator
VVGRGQELRALEQFRESVLQGRSGVVVVHGEPGIGKTTLLERFATQPQACRIETCGGVESEMELAWAGLHQFCVPLLARLDRIPSPQRLALSAAFGLAEGPAPDPFLVGLAVISLLAEAADERPIICIVDDAYALDRSSLRALAFVGRRLQSEAVGLIFVVREVPPDLAGFEELPVLGLGPADAGTLLDAVTPTRLDPRVHQRIIAETSGNPLAIVELADAGHLRRLAGGYGTPVASPIRSRIEDRFLEAFGQLAEGARRVLMLAAAEPTGDSALLRRAAQFIGVELPDRDDLQVQRLISFSPSVSFRHPLVRSAIYATASPSERRAAHRALAEATDPEHDPDRRVWHLAQAQDGPDEDIAVQLDRSAARALARGGHAGAAAFLVRAAQLTPDPALRARRELAAASARFQSGDPDGALELLDSAHAHGLDDVLLARAELLRGQVTFLKTRGGRAPALLLGAARRLEPFDPAGAREAYISAMSAAIFAGGYSSEPLESIAAIVLAQAPVVDPPRPVDRLLDGMAARFATGVEASIAPTRAANRAFLAEWPPSTVSTPYMWTFARMALETLECEVALDIADRQVQVVRESGALALLPMAIVPLATAHLLRGDLATGESLALEALGVAAHAGVPAPAWPLLLARALHGDPDRFTPLAASTLADARESGEGHILHFADVALAILSNGRGDYRTTLSRAMDHAGRGCPEFLYASMLGFEFVEAASRAGAPADIDAAQRFSDQLTRASTSGWGRGLAAITAVLLTSASAADAEALYREAQAQFAASGMAMYAARVRLLFGEWLRREGRRKESRDELRDALAALSSMGLGAFAARAVHELELAGESNARRRPPASDEELTPQELQVAQLAAAGLSNREIAERLFLSHRTVASHLYRVYPKLGITSRNQLHRVLSPPGA